jgi:ABC-2 type transport system permease protein
VARGDQKIQRGGRMMTSLSRFWQLLKASVRMNVQTDLAYRGEAVVGILMAIFWIAYELASIAIIFSNTSTIGGWGFGEIVALTGVWKLMNGFMFAWLQPNTEKFNEGVRNGTLDYVFLQPVNSQLIVSINRFMLWRMVEQLFAIAMIVIGLSMSAGLGSVSNVLSFLLLTISGVAIIYSAWIILISLTFWFTKFDNSVTILQALMDSGRFPATVYPAWLRAIITFVVPIAIAMTVPLQALRGELVWWQVLAFLGIGIAMVLASAAIWRAGSKKYAGASS